MAEWRVTGRVFPGSDGGFDVDLVVTGEAVPRAKSSKVKVASLSDDDLAASVSRAMDDMGSELASLASQMVDLLAKENKSGKVSLSRAYREVYLPVMNLASGGGQEAVAFGLGQAIAKGIPNVNYAKKAAASYSVAPAPVEYMDRYEMVGE